MTVRHNDPITRNFGAEFEMLFKRMMITFMIFVCALCVYVSIETANSSHCHDRNNALPNHSDTDHTEFVPDLLSDTHTA